MSDFIGPASIPCTFLRLPMEIRQIVYNKVFSQSTFENFPNKYFDLVMTNHRIHNETFDFAMKRFYTFEHIFRVRVEAVSNKPSEFELILGPHVEDGGAGNQSPGKSVDGETLRKFGSISIWFDWSWTKTIMLSTQAFKTVIQLLVSIFKTKATPISLNISLPWYPYPRGPFGKIGMDLEALAFLPAVCDVTLNGNPAWHYEVLEQWRAKRWAFELTGRREKTMEDAMDGFLDVIEKRVQAAAAIEMQFQEQTK